MGCRSALLAVVAVSGCASDREQQPLGQVADPADLTGDWTTGAWDLYSTAFIDSTQIVFDNHIDTLYRYNWRLDSNILVLRDILGDELRPALLKLTEDSLVLASMPNHREPLRYSRCEDPARSLPSCGTV